MQSDDILKVAVAITTSNYGIGTKKRKRQQFFPLFCNNNSCMFKHQQKQKQAVKCFTRVTQALTLLLETIVHAVNIVLKMLKDEKMQTLPKIWAAATVSLHGATYAYKAFSLSLCAYQCLGTIQKKFT